MGGHVKTVGEQRHRTEGDTRRHLDEHGHGGHESDDQGAPFPRPASIQTERVVMLPCRSTCLVHRFPPSGKPVRRLSLCPALRSQNLAAVVVGPLAVSHGEAPADKSVNDSRRVLARHFDRTATLDSLPVEYRDIGRQAGLQPAAVSEPQALGLERAYAARHLSPCDVSRKATARPESEPGRVRGDDRHDARAVPGRAEAPATHSLTIEVREG